MTNKKQDEAARIRNAVLNLIEVLDADEPDWRPIDGETTDYDIAWNQLIEIVENPNLPIHEAIISEITKNGAMTTRELDAAINTTLRTIQNYIAKMQTDGELASERTNGGYPLRYFLTGKS